MLHTCLGVSALISLRQLIEMPQHTGAGNPTAPEAVPRPAYKAGGLAPVKLSVTQAQVTAGNPGLDTCVFLTSFPPPFLEMPILQPPNVRKGQQNSVLVCRIWAWRVTQVRFKAIFSFFLSFLLIQQLPRVEGQNKGSVCLRNLEHFSG